jgi:hypothetical protein
MTEQTTFTNLSEAFAKTFQDETFQNETFQDEKYGLTENGDVQFAEMGQEFKDYLLELDHKMVLPITDQQKGELSLETKSVLDYHFDKCITAAKMMKDDENKAEAFNLMFRYLFYLRSVRHDGKKAKLLSYYLFDRLHCEFPETAYALLSLFPEYGYFGDLNNIMTLMDYDNKIISTALSIYEKHLNKDCNIIFGKPLFEISNMEAETLNKKLKQYTTKELKEFLADKRVSLASKWFSSEGKKYSDIRDEFIKKYYYSKYDIESVSSDDIIRSKAHKKFNYYQMTLRNVISTLRQCIMVGETMMCETNPNGRTWSDINHNNSPAGFTTKYRKALLNEELKSAVPEYNIETGNRHPMNPDRVECRKNLLKTLVEGKLKGAATDINKLSKIISNYVHSNLRSLSVYERKVISSQWNDIVSKLKEQIQEIVGLSKLNIIPIVDTSGSMGSAQVDHIAIGLGILCSSLSTMVGCMISFSERPKVFHLDFSENKDVFDHFTTIMKGPTGLSTNIDLTYKTLLELMVMSGMKETDFSLLFLTDGQFDQQVIYSNHESQQTFIQRIEKAFNDKGYNLPRSIFWNLNGMYPGFPATSSMKGVQMVSGYSQTLMKQVFIGDYKYEIMKDGSMKVDIDPWTTFHKAITCKTFDMVSIILCRTNEGVFSELMPPLI